MCCIDYKGDNVAYYFDDVLLEEVKAIMRGLDNELEEVNMKALFGVTHEDRGLRHFHLLIRKGWYGD